ncbi:unnamed protein product, partial [Mesorhabditis belari]|uniref:Uncharacterized protein n=1 Tax=Mesorhabditis belari TaxID=2138241 RepID=A0AAF3EDV9_9BILA
MSYSTLLIAALLAVSYGFTKIPNSYTIAERTSACQDYCKGQSISVTTGFPFLTNQWQLCNCPIAQLSGQMPAEMCGYMGYLREIGWLEQHWCLLLDS